MSDELLPQFLFEAREQLEASANALLSLDRDARGGARQDRAALDRAFRGVHTVKGATGLFDLLPMGRLLHAAEDGLDGLRCGRETLDGPMLDALLDTFGLCERWLDAVEHTGRLPPGADAEGDTHIVRLGGGRAEATGAAASVVAGRDTSPDPLSDSLPDWAASLARRFAEAVGVAQQAGETILALRYTPAPDCFFLGDDPLAPLRAVPSLLGVSVGPRSSWDPDGMDPFRCDLAAALLSTAPAAALRALFRTVPDQIEIASLPAMPPPPAIEPAEREAGGENASPLLRVEAGRVDRVVELAGEMMLARNRLDTLLPRAEALDPAFGRALAATQGEIDRLTRMLRQAATGLRLAPLERLFRRLPRLVREIAAAADRQVALDLSGGTVELDRAVADAVFEPLLHVLRNAVGHGIEPVAARRAAGKPAEGHIAVSARAEGDRVLIVVEDDGAGIDPERVRAAAGRRGVLAADRLAALDEVGCLQLLFLPGFSTAERVTSLSGRGVGMDAVRAAVVRSDGEVFLRSRVGLGTTITLSLPRTVSATGVLLLEAGGEPFGVPVEAVREIVHITADRISPLGEGVATMFRGHVLPLLRLSDLLSLDAPGALGEGPCTVVVTNGTDGPLGFVVDRVRGRAELLLRQPGAILRGVRGLAGTALAPDGRVLTVLDLLALLDRTETGE